MSKIIATCGQKGGAGKTTVSMSIAAEFMQRGLSVLLADVDPQRTALTWSQVAAELKKPGPTIVHMGENFGSDDQLPRLAANFDVTVIDCPPRMGNVQKDALLIADLGLFPCGPSTLDTWALAASMPLVEAARHYRPDLIVRLLVTKKVAGTVVGKQAKEVLAGTGIPLLETEIHYRTPFQEAAAAGVGVTVYAPRDKAAQEVRSVVDEITALLGMRTLDCLVAT